MYLRFLRQQQRLRSQSQPRLRSMLAHHKCIFFFSFRMVEGPYDSLDVIVGIVPQLPIQRGRITNKLIVRNLFSVASIPGTWVYNFPTFRVRIARLNSPPTVGYIMSHCSCIQSVNRSQRTVTPSMLTRSPSAAPIRTSPIPISRNPTIWECAVSI
jgi:hypothetical protein